MNAAIDNMIRHELSDNKKVLAGGGVDDQPTKDPGAVDVMDSSDKQMVEIHGDFEKFHRVRIGVNNCLGDVECVIDELFDASQTSESDALSCALVVAQGAAQRLDAQATGVLMVNLRELKALHVCVYHLLCREFLPDDEPSKYRLRVAYESFGQALENAVTTSTDNNQAYQQ
jgi:hypothetical protein